MNSAKTDPTMTPTIDTVLSIVVDAHFLRFYEILILPRVCKQWNALVDCGTILHAHVYDKEWKAILKLVDEQNCLHKCPRCDHALVLDSVEPCDCQQHTSMTATIQRLRDTICLEENDPRWDPTFSSLPLQVQAKRLVNYHCSCLENYSRHGQGPNYVSTTFLTLLESYDAYPEPCIAPAWQWLCRTNPQLYTLMLQMFAKIIAMKIVTSTPTVEWAQDCWVVNWYEEQIVPLATQSMACLLGGCSGCDSLWKEHGTVWQQALGPDLARKMDLLAEERALIAAKEEPWLPLGQLETVSCDDCEDAITCFHGKSIPLPTQFPPAQASEGVVAKDDGNNDDGDTMDASVAAKKQKIS